jgi:hypothetical protein
MAESGLQRRLRRLPLRAQLAFAARCARRVQPLATRVPDDPAKHEAVERAIHVAEQLARGDRVTQAEAGSAYDGARDAARSAWDGGDPTASRARDAAAYTAQAASHVRPGSRLGPAADASRAAFYAYNDSGDAANAVEARATFDAAASSDLTQLARLKLGTSPNLGAAIDPSESGPLGPLWPKGAPEGWPDDRTTDSPRTGPWGEPGEGID